jgi:hypothetical protein
MDKTIYSVEEMCFEKMQKAQLKIAELYRQLLVATTAYNDAIKIVGSESIETTEPILEPCYATIKEESQTKWYLPSYSESFKCVALRKNGIISSIRYAEFNGKFEIWKHMSGNNYKYKIQPIWVNKVDKSIITNLQKQLNELFEETQFEKEILQRSVLLQGKPLNQLFEETQFEKEILQRSVLLQRKPI